MQIAEVLRVAAHLSEGDAEAIGNAITKPIGIKTLLMVAEMAKQGAKDGAVDVNVFLECLHTFPKQDEPQRSFTEDHGLFSDFMDSSLCLLFHEGTTLDVKSILIKAALPSRAWISPILTSKRAHRECIFTHLSHYPAAQVPA
ncbi:hypothetical protein THAOC_30465 [Thalassiosira oceanica]|uniref:Uncharacterized protein n=1 Tax=Thalassiosira oceanica TaxID=159749 RepID=K0RA65_THAOC|nr:hypothetical protein THAOC_30465 [Thalassiosira oceanica]|eukprot:EJK50533.1 hypothetical protein THAOC_30465 [Thalassiosira oceanica]